MTRKLRILSVYVFATIGGVERVLLNRAIDFNRSRLPVSIDAFFLNDYGGKRALRNAIASYRLHNTLRVVDNPDLNSYDAFTVIDTPEIFEFLPSAARLIVECHTSRFVAQKYLKNLPRHTYSVAAPSEALKAQISGYTDLPISLIPNRVPLHENDVSEVWNCPLMFYAGRIEEGKNVEEVVRVFEVCQKLVTDLKLMIVTPTLDYSGLSNLISNLRLQNHVFFKGGSGFYETSRLYANIAKGKAIFISSSLHETWGLSAAEALANKIPVILSNNTGHKEVVVNSNRFLYEMGDVEAAADRAVQSLEAQNSPDVSQLHDFHSNTSDSTDKLIEILDI